MNEEAGRKEKEKRETRREKGEGRKEKGERRKEKGEGRRGSENEFVCLLSLQLMDSEFRLAIELTVAFLLQNQFFTDGTSLTKGCSSILQQQQPSPITPSSASSTAPRIVLAQKEGGYDGHDDHEIQNENDSHMLLPMNNSEEHDDQGLIELPLQYSRSKRLIWTDELHKSFLRAVEELGMEAAPKAIMTEMNVKGITRENVASHLQKFRKTRSTSKRPGHPYLDPRSAWHHYNFDVFQNCNATKII